MPTYRSGDPKTAFRSQSAAEILCEYGPPKSLLSSSAKTDKCRNVDVFGGVLYMTPGMFCPSSTAACRAGCLGHTSGNMHQPGPTRGAFEEMGVKDEDGNVTERTALTMPGQIAAGSIPCRWTQGRTLYVCNADQSGNYDRVISRFRDITDDFVRGWNYRFPDKAFAAEESATTE